MYTFKVFHISVQRFLIGTVEAEDYFGAMIAARKKWPDKYPYLQVELQ